MSSERGCDSLDTGLINTGTVKLEEELYSCENKIFTEIEDLPS